MAEPYVPTREDVCAVLREEYERGARWPVAAVTWETWRALEGTWLRPDTVVRKPL